MNNKNRLYNEFDPYNRACIQNYIILNNIYVLYNCFINNLCRFKVNINYYLDKLLQLWDVINDL